MTQDEMYDDIRLQLRKGERNPVNAIYNTIKKAASIDFLPFHSHEKHLYVRIDNIPFMSVEILAYLARVNNLETGFVAASRNDNDISPKVPSTYPYLHIFTKN